MAAAFIALTGCTSHNAKPIMSGTVTGLRYEREYETLEVVGKTLVPKKHPECWRVTFEGKGQIAYDCADKAKWNHLKVGDLYSKVK
jgi:hypothetical protein